MKLPGLFPETGYRREFYEKMPLTSGNFPAGKLTFEAFKYRKGIHFRLFLKNLKHPEAPEK